MKTEHIWKAISAVSAACLVGGAALLPSPTTSGPGGGSPDAPDLAPELSKTFDSGSPASPPDLGPRLVTSGKGKESDRNETSQSEVGGDSVHSVPQLLGSWRSALFSGGADLALLYVSIQQGLEKSATDAEVKSHALIGALSEVEVPLGERGHLARLVGESTSVAGTAALLDLASSEDEELFMLAWRGLEMVGLRPERNLDQSEAVVELLESRFHELRGVEGIGAGAVALAQLGTPRSVEFLLELYSQPHSDEMVGALNRAFSRILNPDAVTVLGEHLRRGDLDDPKTEVSGFALANMSSARASGMLGEWAIRATDEDADYAAYLFQLASRGEDSLRMLTSYAEIEIFESEAVKRELETVIQTIKLSRQEG